MELFKGLRRLLKPTGVVWLNLGDTFYHAGKVRGTHRPGSIALACTTIWSLQDGEACP